MGLIFDRLISGGIQLLVGGVIFVYMINFIVTTVDGSCKKHYNQERLEGGTVIDSTFVRTLHPSSPHKHYIKVALIQPKDLSAPGKTIVCHFRENTFNLEKVETFDGSLFEKVIRMSSSNLNPVTQVRWLLFEMGF